MRTDNKISPSVELVAGGLYRFRLSTSECIFAMIIDATTHQSDHGAYIKCTIINSEGVINSFITTPGGFLEGRLELVWHPKQPVEL